MFRKMILVLCLIAFLPNNAKAQFAVFDASNIASAIERVMNLSEQMKKIKATIGSMEKTAKALGDAKKTISQYSTKVKGMVGDVKDAASQAQDKMSFIQIPVTEDSIITAYFSGSATIINAQSSNGMAVEDLIPEIMLEDGFKPDWSIEEMATFINEKYATKLEDATPQEEAGRYNKIRSMLVDNVDLAMSKSISAQQQSNNIDEQMKELEAVLSESTTERDDVASLTLTDHETTKRLMHLNDLWATSLALDAVNTLGELE